MVLLDTGAGEDHGLVGQEIYLDILGFVAPGAAFGAHGFCAAVWIAQKCGDFAVFHTHFQLVVIFFGDLAAACCKELGGQQRQQEQLHFFTHQLLLLYLWLTRASLRAGFL